MKSVTIGDGPLFRLPGVQEEGPCPADAGAHALPSHVFLVCRSHPSEPLVKGGEKLVR
jgi:hypothetical protein